MWLTTDFTEILDPKPRTRSEDRQGSKFIIEFLPSMFLQEILLLVVGKLSFNVSVSYSATFT